MASQARPHEVAKRHAMNAKKAEERKETQFEQENRYPKCLKLVPMLYEDCPDPATVDVNNPPSVCRSCPQFKPTPQMLAEKRKQMLELMNSVKIDKN